MTVVRCPHCGSPILESKKTCPICARQIKQASPAPGAPAPKTIDKKTEDKVKSYALLGVLVVVVGLFSGSISYVLAKPILGAECLASMLLSLLGVVMVVSLPITLTIRSRRKR